MHNTLSNICCVGGIRCCVGGLPYTTHFQIYNVCFVGSSRCCVRGLPYATHFQTYVVLEVNMLCWRFTIRNALSKYVVCKSLPTIVMLVLHTHKGI